MRERGERTVNFVNPDYSGESKKIRRGARGIIENNGKVLLIYEKNIDQYMIPGGGVEVDETLSDCCRREMEEETGVVCEVRENYLVINEFFGSTNFISYYFVCEATGTQGQVHLTKTERESGLTCVFVDMEQALEIFGQYTDYEKSDKMKFGLYRRELLALNAYIEFTGKQRL